MVKDKQIVYSVYVLIFIDSIFGLGWNMNYFIVSILSLVKVITVGKGLIGFTVSSKK